MTATGRRFTWATVPIPFFTSICKLIGFSEHPRICKIIGSRGSTSIGTSTSTTSVRTHTPVWDVERHISVSMSRFVLLSTSNSASHQGLYFSLSTFLTVSDRSRDKRKKPTKMNRIDKRSIRWRTITTKKQQQQSTREIANYRGGQGLPGSVSISIIDAILIDIDVINGKIPLSIWCIRFIDVFLAPGICKGMLP
jgi:hypothetical protein